MNHFTASLLAQLKRIRKVFPFVFCMTILLTAGILLLALAMQKSDALSERKAKINIALVGNAEDTYLGFGFSAIQKLDPSRYTIDFLNMEEKEAQDKLERGEINAYVVIPDGFIESVNNGENKPLTYAVDGSASNMGTILMNELIGIISDLFTNSQNVIYGIRQLIAERNMWDIFGEATDTLFLHLMNLFLNRMDLFLTDCLGASNGLSFLSYYFTAFFILFMLFWGITCSSLFVKRDCSLPCLLKARGQNAVSQILAEYIAYLTLMMTNLLLLILPLGLVFHLFGIKPTEWEAGIMTELFLFVVKLLPAAAVIAALHFFLYELISDMISGILLQFLTAVSLSYLSGCLYPITFFPESIQKLAPWLPSGVCLSYAGRCLQSLAPWREAALLSLYFILFLGLSGAVRTRRIKG